MFVFLSASVSYDPITILLAVASIYFMMRYLKDFNLRNLFLFILISLLGILVKITIAPLTFFAFLIIIWEIFNKKKISSVKKIDFKTIIILVPIILALFFLCLIYLSNFFTYKTFFPSCKDVLGHEICYEYSALYRQEGYQFKVIDILTKEGVKAIFSSRLSIIEYIFSWTQRMLTTIYGITGFKVLNHSSWFISLYHVVFISLLTLVVRFYDIRNRMINKIMLVTISYSVFLLFYNYKTYLESGNFYARLQGRYIFPVLPIIYVILLYYITKINNKILRMFFILGVVLIWFYGCYIFFIFNYPSNWFQGLLYY
jgi:hypothetical protein